MTDIVQEGMVDEPVEQELPVDVVKGPVDPVEASIEQGSSPLLQVATVDLSNRQINAKKQELMEQPDEKKRPPLDRLQDAAIEALVAPPIREAAARLNQTIMTVIECIGIRRDDDGFRGEYVFEVAPEIQLPDLSKCEIKVPEPTVDDEYFANLINGLPARFPEWIEVDRASKLADRLIFGNKKENAWHQVIGPELQPELRASLLGKKAGETLTLPEGRTLQVHRVEEPKIPPLDLDFFKKLNPQCTSREDFERQVREEHAEHMRRSIAQIMSRRAPEQLEQVTPKFPVPLSEISRELTGWRQNVMRQYPDAEDLLDVYDSDTIVKTKQQLTESIHQRLLLRAFIAKHNLDATDEEMNKRIDALAANEKNPQRARSRLKADSQRKLQIESEIVFAKACTKIVDEMRNVAEKMTVEEIERLAAGNPADAGADSSSAQ